MNFNELCTRTRELAASGIDLDSILFDDAIGDAYCELFRSGELDKDKLEAAFIEGRRAFRMAKGWIVVWTSATEEYDQFDTDELECCEWNGKRLRRVLVHPENVVYQRSRYMSGAWCWDEDPREIERKIQEGLACEKAEREARRIARDEGLAWLRTVPDADLEPTQYKNRAVMFLEKRIDWIDVAEEHRRRFNEKERAQRKAEWDKCRSMFPDGCTIVDPGREKSRPSTEPIPASDCAVYRNVRVVPHWSAKDSVEDARVEDERHEFVGSLCRVARLLELGLLRVATPDERLPPNAVLDRLKVHYLHEIVRVETEGRSVWVARERWSWTTIVVLDDQGKLVRKKSVKETAERALCAKEGLS